MRKEKAAIEAMHAEALAEVEEKGVRPLHDPARTRRLSPRLNHPDYLQLAVVRLLRNVRLDEETGCWNWVGRTTNRYPRTKFQGKEIRINQLSARIFRGEQPTGLHVLHHCDNPRCANPAHLYYGTDQDNADDCRRRGRHTKGERHGQAKLKEADVRAIRSSPLSGKELAELYGVHLSNIYRVRSRKYWKHVT